MDRDRITRFGARAPGAEYNPTPRRHTKEPSARHSAGQPIRTPQCAKDGGKPGVKWRMPGAGLSQRCPGKAPSDTPAFQPYRGNPAVRKRVQQKLVCSVGGRPTEVTVRSLVAWIAECRETESRKPIDKAILRMVSESSGRNESERRYGLEKRKLQKPSPLP